MKIAVIGTGYVGLVAGTCFAESGNTVICVDNDEKKVRALLDGKIPIYEPGLDELVKRNVSEERLFFSMDLADAVRKSTIVFVAVGTPQGEDGSADLRHVLGVANEIGKAMDGYRAIVIKSTVPVGTNKKVRDVIAAVTTQVFDVVSNPEFLKEGAAIEDFMKPDRVVIGTSEPRVAEIMKELYQPFVRTGKPIMVMDEASAELTKYAANAMLATRISFMNEIANLCERVGADVNRVREGMGSDSRIGFPFLFPGVGYGGSCFPKDVQALVRTAAEFGYETKIVNAVESVNRDQKRVLFEKVKKHFGEKNLKGKTFAVWGLAFKPRTDDMREAPSITLIDSLLAAGAKVRASDPEAIDMAWRLYGDKITYCHKNYEACEGADALVIVTEWNEFRRPDFDKLKSLLKNPVVFDGRNIFEPKRLRSMGFTYYGIGMP
ncbi:MAG: UDP-glucose/GDP-mannose dehydrogenase family protein [Planctomycetes bacterium]|nr:UDP-glucose/GDP-mannose dehydrogenase family protein [Planctomycetota bacterium]MBI3847834.1 UDP-glucose/GDP-mannose dehydrogenase family protein [Planctomycetota bacterium]